MPFCTNCGHKVPEGSLFCESCGTRMDAAVPAHPTGENVQAPPPAAGPGPANPNPASQAPQQPPVYGGQTPYSGQTPYQPAGQPPYEAAPGYGQPAAAAAPQPRAPRKPLPLGVKIGAAVAVALVAVFALVCFILNKINDPQKTIKTFVNSIITQDFDAFRSVTVCASPDIELSKTSAAPFLTLYSGNTSMLSNFRDSLTSDLQLLEQGADTTGDGLVRLIEEDHVIFKSYKVELSTVKAVFISPLDNARLSVAGKILDMPVADREYSVNILPGRYEVKATATEPTFDATFTYENKSLNVGAAGLTSSLEFEYATVVLTRQELDPTSLTVNGKSCDIPEFDDYGTAFLTPLPVDAQLTATFEYAGVTLSASFTCDGPDQRYFFMEPTLDEESTLAILNTAADFTNGWLQSYADGDVAGIQALCSGKSSFLSGLAYQLRNSQNTNSWRYAYHYTLRELEGDLDLNRSNDFYADNSPCFSSLLFLSLDYTEEYLAPANYQYPVQDDPVQDDPNQPNFGDPDFGTPGAAQPTAPAEPEVYNESMMLKVSIQYVDGAWQVVSYDRVYNVGRSDISNPRSLM